MNSNLVVIGKTNIDNDKEDFDNEAEDDDADNGDESEGDDFEQETGWHALYVQCIYGLLGSSWF